MPMQRKSFTAPSPPGSLRERAYAHIQRGIATGDLKPDTSISEVLLARTLKMSRTPIREAINQLVAEGLLEQTPNRGTLVVRLQRQDVIELYELREALEVYAVRKAAQLPLRSADLERWAQYSAEIALLGKQLQKSSRTTLTSEQMRQFVAADLNFHNMLMRMSVHGRIHKVLNDTRLLIRIFGIERPDYDVATLERIHQQHADIISAVRNGEAELASNLLAKHIEISLQERLQAYDSWERERSFQKNLPDFFSTSST
jgi:DNA-binding GntR family transcriptional regulator